MPVQVSSHVKDGHFDPGNFGWLRGAFAGASPAEVADWTAIKTYGDKCGGEVPDATRAEMTAMGEHPSADYWLTYSNDVCGELAPVQRSFAGFASWTDYRRSLNTALP